MAAAAAALVAATPVAPAVAAVTGSHGAFGLTPAPDQAGHSPPYFMLTVPAGHSAIATALLQNLGDSTENLKVSRSTGITAANGGTSFTSSFRRCAGVGCWVAGLPAAVTLPVAAGTLMQFSVHVPARTPPGQYLAGVTAEAAATPRSVQVGSRGGTSARAIIVEQATLGVAVTVGSLSRMITRLRIPGVFGQTIGSTARLEIRLRNTGQTFTHAAGTAACIVDGQRHRFAVVADTILPHEQALIAANASAVPVGATVWCAVRLSYGNGQVVRWAGRVTVPAAPHVRIVHTGPGAYSVVPAPSIPPWAIALLVIGGLILVGVGALLLRTRKRGRARGRPGDGISKRLA